MGKELLRLINNINSIYSRSYKKFIDLNHSRYENEQDLYYDILFKIELWDSHASINIPSYITKYNKINWRINKYGNAYIMLPNIKYCETNIKKYHTILREIVAKKPKNITINLTAQTTELDRRISINIIKYIMPLINESSEMLLCIENENSFSAKYILTNKECSVTAGKESLHVYNDTIIPYNGTVNLIIPNTIATSNICILTKSIKNIMCYLYTTINDRLIMPVFINYNGEIKYKFGINIGHYENPSPVSNLIIGEIPNELMPHAK